MDSAGKPLPSASVTRTPGGPGASADTLGRATFFLSQRDVSRTDSTDVTVRRIGYSGIHVPVRVAAGDSVDIAAWMCPANYRLSSGPMPSAPVHERAGAGAGIGAIAGTIVGYLSEHGSCDPTPSRRCTGTGGAVAGAAIGGVIGYGIGHLVRSQSACMPPDEWSKGIVMSMRAMVDTNDTRLPVLRARYRIPAAPREQVYVVTDDRTCRRAREALDSLIHAESPTAPGLRRIPSVYVVRAGSIVDVETPRSSASNIFDAKTWRFLFALVVPD